VTVFKKIILNVEIVLGISGHSASFSTQVSSLKDKAFQIFW